MTTAVRTSIIRIGNSRGIRIPKLLLEQMRFVENEEVDLLVEKNQLVVRPVRKAREGWDAEFKEMAEFGDNELAGWDTYIPTKWDEEEWEW